MIAIHCVRKAFASANTEASKSSSRPRYPSRRWPYPRLTCRPAAFGTSDGTPAPAHPTRRHRCGSATAAEADCERHSDEQPSRAKRCAVHGKFPPRINFLSQQLNYQVPIITKYVCNFTNLFYLQSIPNLPYCIAFLVSTK